MSSAIAIDPVAVQIERDVVGADHDAVVGAVDEIAAEGGVGCDRVAAVKVTRQSAIAAEKKDHSDGPREDRGEEAQH